MRLFNDKRGNWQDVLEYGVGALVFAVILILGFVMINNFNSTLHTVASTDSTLNDTIALGYMDEAEAGYYKSDFILPVLYVVFLSFSMWSARKIESSHKFLWIGLIMLVLLVLFSLLIEVLWEEFILVPSIAGVIGGFNYTNFFLSYLRYFVIIYGFFVGVALYAKNE